MSLVDLAPGVVLTGGPYAEREDCWGCGMPTAHRLRRWLIDGGRPAAVAKRPTVPYCEWCADLLAMRGHLRDAESRPQPEG